MSDIDSAANEPPGFQPRLLRPGFALFGSLGLIVAIENVGDGEGVGCAPQTSASGARIGKTAQINHNGRGILD